MTVVTLDLRDLANEWRESVAEMEANVLNTEGMSWGELAEATDAFMREPEQVAGQTKYVELCEQLGCEPDPDSLEDHGNGHEPTLVLESAFEEYAEELASDIGAIDSDAGWPLSYIDWEAAADALRVDYTSVTYDGDDYLIRS